MGIGIREIREIRVKAWSRFIPALTGFSLREGNRQRNVRQGNKAKPLIPKAAVETANYAKHTNGGTGNFFDANYANCREWELEFALIREICVKACSRISRFIPTAVSNSFR